MARSARPRTLAGSSSSMAELIAAYSPPIPAPVSARNSAKVTNPVDAAVSSVATRYTESVTRKRRFLPTRSVSRPKTSAPRMAPARYAVAAPPTCCSVRASVSGRTSAPATAPTSVTSSPSRTQVIPRAITTRQCHADHGSRSSRAGMSVSTSVGASIDWGAG